MEQYLDPYDMQKLQMEMENGTFMEMQRMCFRKCVKKTKDNEFPIGEMSCSDRCVAKFFAMQKIVNEQFETYKQQKEQEQAILQQQAAQQQAMYGQR